MATLVLIISLIYVSILLTVNFFLLFAVGRVKRQGLRNFGYVITVFIWIVVALIVISSFDYLTG